MQVKKFEAPTIQEALETIKRELGPEAIILQTKKNKRGFGLMSNGSVEITAAVSDRSLQKKTYIEQRVPESTKEQLQKLPADRQADVLNKYADRNMGKGSGKNPSETKRITATRYIDIDTPAPQSTAPRAAATSAGAAAAKLAVNSKMSVEDEMKHLKRMIEELRSAQESGVSGSGAQALSPSSGFQTPALQDAFEQLVLNGMDKRYAYSIVKKASFELGDAKSRDPEAVIDEVAAEIMQTSETSFAFNGVRAGNSGNGPSVIALVGPTGVGKTTTVAKLASEAILKRNLKVGLINLDSYKVAAFDQLGTYAKILNVPFRSVSSVEDLNAALADFKALDLVLLDTTGRSQRDPASLSEMHEMLKHIPDLRTELVLSVTTRDNELYDMANRFSVFRPQGIIVSKLDEASIYGSIYNVSQKVKLPLLYFTTGQRVPEDIEEASPERLAALILDL